MEISKHNVSFASSHRLSSSYLKRERLEVWRGKNPHRNAQNRGQSSPPRPTPDASQLIEPDRVKTTTESKDPTGKISGDDDTPRTQEELELKILIESISAMLKDSKLRFRDPGTEQIKKAYEEGEKTIEAVENRADRTVSGPRNRREEADWGLRYDSSERYEETESLRFQARGRVRTRDGRSIDFEVNLSMHRKFVVENETHLRAGNARPVDPLVINYDGKAAELSESKFRFDLDMDGTLESLNALKSGSGFLGLDKNGNGSIDDGSELFGPRTGNGFEELASYDSDGNRFVDEGDPAYDRLYVMKPSTEGPLETVPAKRLDVGAIFLGSSDTSFSFKDGLQLQGQLRRSGIYLTENGEAGTVQQIDLVPGDATSSDSPSGVIDVLG